MTSRSGVIALELIEALIDVEEYDRATEALRIFAPKVLEGAGQRS